MREAPGQTGGGCVCDSAHEYAPSMQHWQTVRLIAIAFFFLCAVFACATGATLLAAVFGFIIGATTRAYFCDRNLAVTV